MTSVVAVSPRETLLDKGARFVELQAEGKIPLHKSWQRKQLDRDTALSAKRLGVIPSSLGLVVIDVDVHDNGELDDRVRLVRDKLGAELSYCPTPSGGAHLFYKTPEETVANRTWLFGDVRGSKGFVVIWDDGTELMNAVSRLSNAEAPNLAKLPRKNKSRLEPGNRNNALNTAAFDLARQGLLTSEKRQELTDKGLEAGLELSEINATLDSAAKAGEETRKLTFSYKDADALRQVLEILGIEFRFNLRAKRAEMREQEGEWEPTDDLAIDDLRSRIAKKFSYAVSRTTAPLHYGRDTWTMCFNTILFHHRVDPFRLWLESLPQWDGVKRIDSYLVDFFRLGSNDSELTRWVSQFLLLGVVQRTYEPGSKLDEMPVLYGEQGIGKSALLRALLPPEQDAWFCDSLKLTSDTKTRAETLQGRVIVEVAEMTGATRADLESLKAFISQQDDGSVRFAYRRDPVVMLRMCIMVGTSNNELMLPNDPTGLRRFVPIKFNPADSAVEPYITKIREQLWAEALVRYRDGVRAGLPFELRKTAAAVAERHRNSDEIIEDKLDDLDDLMRNGAKGATLQEIAKACDYGEGPLSQSEQQRLGAALRNKGWTKQQLRVDGKPKRRWVKS